MMVWSTGSAGSYPDSKLAYCACAPSVMDSGARLPVRLAAYSRQLAGVGDAGSIGWPAASASRCVHVLGTTCTNSPTRPQPAAGCGLVGEFVQVVPRTWTHLLAEAAGHPIDPASPTPASWREYAARRTGSRAPESMTDGAQAQYASFESGYDPADPVDQTIMATRKAVFPDHGLLPHH